MIYDQCMQKLLTFIMTVIGGGRQGKDEYVCVCLCVRVSGVCGRHEG